MIVLDLCQVLLITYLKFTKKNARKGEKLNQHAILLALKIINYITNAINELIKKLPNVYQFCNEDINKFVLLLRKGVYHTNTWERFNERSLPDKKSFLQ